MSIENHTTIESYSKNTREYRLYTPQDRAGSSEIMWDWIDRTVSYMPVGSKLLEIGSATSRDAKYIRSKNIEVQCSDAAASFVQQMRLEGEEALLLNVTTDPIPAGYSAIFANAVVPHFTSSDFQIVLKKVYDALPHEGIFSFSTKVGTGEQWVTEKSVGQRFIHYWNEEELLSFVTAVGFKLLYSSTNIGNLPNHSWINLILQKP